MKWLLCPLLLSAFALTACGGSASSPPSQSPTVHAAALTETETARTSAIGCDAPLPDGPISFQGVVTETHPFFYQSELSLSIRRIKAQAGVAIHGSEDDWVNSVLSVVWLGSEQDVRQFKPGDCVLGSGNVQQYVTHPISSSVGFVADQLIRSDAAEATPLPETDRQRFWMIAQVGTAIPAYRGTDYGYRDVNLLGQGVIASSISNGAWPPELHGILLDSTQLPDIAGGDRIEVIAEQGRYACGASCDAAGFLITYLRKLD